MMRAVVAVGVLMLGVTAVIAQQDQLKETQAIMKANGKNAGALSAILKGEKPYDQATVDTALAQFEDTAKKLPTPFPDGAKGLKPATGDYSSSPKIWEDKAGFAAQVASFSQAVSDAKSKAKDLDSLKASFPAGAKSCGG